MCHSLLQLGTSLGAAVAVEREMMLLLVLALLPMLLKGHGQGEPLAGSDVLGSRLFLTFECALSASN